MLTYAVHAIRGAFALGLALLVVNGDADAARRPARPRASARRRIARPAVHRPFVPAVVVPASASVRDVEIGEACRRGLGETRGAVVAMDPYTGRVISIVNPEDALLAAYQPCSVFKIVVAVAGLTEGIITPETIHDCHGGCWLWPGHGPIDLRRALAQSCNPYFEAVGERLGYDRVQRYAFLLGLGSPTGINLEGEDAGRIPEVLAASRGER